ncbi:helix-turn-helix domain-containing protein [Thermobifida halotolerans]|uniref:Helix-turn-helix domain-containing protein n=1 Tax=Thermobifida halotolerans TaxID=483545 RepID=A0AA97LVJ9_9ACTN|nr:helix-turn-helix transcriptional regulator [Thermobifida halotolerans]UOE18937.1 helix-turn-helix domain-containing protein [Thermobifida halotolerans]
MTSPIVRRRRLSAELRRWRVRAGMTLSDAAEELDWSPAKLGHIETGIRKKLSIPEVSALLQLYGVTGGQREAILTLAREARTRPWWSDYENVVSSAYVGNEAGAVAIDTYGGALIPDLLQAPEYTALLARSRGYNGRLTDRMVAAYLNRQENLDRDTLTRYHALVEEDALQRVTDPETRHAQLSRMIELAEEHERVTIQLLSSSLGPHAGFAGPFTVLGFDEGESSLVFVDNPHGGTIVEAEADVASYQEVWHDLVGMAADRQDTVTVLRRLDLLT